MAKTQGFAFVDQFVADVLRSALHFDRPQPADPERPLWEALSSSMVGLEEALPADGAQEHDRYIAESQITPNSGSRQVDS